MFNCFGQKATEINKELEIPNTLEYQQEIRIYKTPAKGKTTFLRMYNEKKNNWIVEISYYDNSLKQITKIDKILFPKKSIGKLNPKDAELIWFDLLVTNVEFLPNMEAIMYKFGKPHIDFDKGERVISRTKKHIIDGVGYEVFIRNGKIKNSFSFDNPESYLKHYPTVDELISYNELLSILEKEFSF